VSVPLVFLVYAAAAALVWTELRAKGAPRRTRWVALGLTAAACAWSVYAAAALRPASVLGAVEKVLRWIPGLNFFLS